MIYLIIWFSFFLLALLTFSVEIASRIKNIHLSTFLQVCNLTAGTITGYAVFTSIVTLF